MTKKDYFEEAIVDSLEGMILTGVLTDEQVSQLAKAMENAHDNIGQAFYSPPSTYASIAEIKELKTRIKSLEAQVEKERDDFRKNVAMRRNCDPNDVILEGNGHATIRL